MRLNPSRRLQGHPLFTRMPGHAISQCERSRFELRRFPVGPLNAQGKAQLKAVEGEYWKVEFALKEGVTKPSGLQVQRNFQNTARQAGGSVEGNPCTDYGTTLRINRGGREFWAFVGNTDEGYKMYVLAVGQMAQDISVNQLAEKLVKEGVLTLYVNFDTGKATIKPDSEKTQADAAGALKAAPTLKVEVGGHTDNVGSPKDNEKLSADRAQAVMAELVKRGVAANRLTAKGYGQNVPVADNRSALDWELGQHKDRAPTIPPSVSASSWTPCRLQRQRARHAWLRHSDERGRFLQESSRVVFAPLRSIPRSLESRPWNRKS